MLIMLRIDDRLLHGQVAKSWVTTYKINQILILNDEIMNDEFSKMALCLAKPSHVDLQFRSLQNLKKILNEFESSDTKVMCITSDFKDMDKVLDIVQRTSYVNVGGQRNNKSIENIEILDSVILTPKDMALLSKWKNKCIRVGVKQKTTDKEIWLDECFINE